MALGAPSTGGGDKPAPKASGLLASKPPRLQAFLRDAVDPSLGADERAEALCQAIQFEGSDEEEASESSDEEASEDADDSEY